MEATLENSSKCMSKDRNGNGVVIQVIAGVWSPLLFTAVFFFQHGVQASALANLYEAYQLTLDDRALLAALCFGSSLVVGPLVAAALVHGKSLGGGPQFACLTYCIIAIVACLCKNADSLAFLILDRVLMGISALLVYSTFRAWFIRHLAHKVGARESGTRGEKTSFFVQYVTVMACLLSLMRAVISGAAAALAFAYIRHDVSIAHDDAVQHDSHSSQSSHDTDSKHRGAMAEVEVWFYHAGNYWSMVNIVTVVVVFIGIAVSWPEYTADDVCDFLSVRSRRGVRVVENIPFGCELERLKRKKELDRVEIKLIKNKQRRWERKHGDVPMPRWRRRDTKEISRPLGLLERLLRIATLPRIILLAVCVSSVNGLHFLLVLMWLPLLETSGHVAESGAVLIMSVGAVLGIVATFRSLVASMNGAACGSNRHGEAVATNQGDHQDGRTHSIDPLAIELTEAGVSEARIGDLAVDGCLWWSIQRSSIRTAISSGQISLFLALVCLAVPVVSHSFWMRIVALFVLHLCCGAASTAMDVLEAHLIPDSVRVVGGALLQAPLCIGLIGLMKVLHIIGEREMCLIGLVGVVIASLTMWVLSDELRGLGVYDDAQATAAKHALDTASAMALRSSKNNKDQGWRRGGESMRMPRRALYRRRHVIPGRTWAPTASVDGEGTMHAKEERNLLAPVE